MGKVSIQYDDVVKLVLTAPDEYGAEVLISEALVDSAVDFNVGFRSAGNQEAITSDAVAFLDPTNEFVIQNYNRLEKMLLLINLFDDSDIYSWFKITKVTVSRDTQLTNIIDNIEVDLKKTAELQLDYAS